MAIDEEVEDEAHDDSYDREDEKADSMLSNAQTRLSHNTTLSRPFHGKEQDVDAAEFAKGMARMQTHAGATPLSGHARQRRRRGRRLPALRGLRRLPRRALREPAAGRAPKATALAPRRPRGLLAARRPQQAALGHRRRALAAAVEREMRVAMQEIANLRKMAQAKLRATNQLALERSGKTAELAQTKSSPKPTERETSSVADYEAMIYFGSFGSHL